MTKRQHDIERYLRGEMIASEMHALEKEALKDPFLSDALEGWQNSSSDNLLFDLRELRSSVANRTHKHKPKVISIWNWSIGIAAALMLIGISGVYIISNIPKKENPVAQNEQLDPSAFGETKPDTLDIIMPPQTIASSEVPARIRRIERVTSGVQEPRRTEREVEANLTDPSTLQIEREEESQTDRSAIASPELTVNTRVVSGVVTSSEDGSVMPGVNVVVKGTSIGTVTDAEGRYEIALNKPDQKLQFSFIGVKTLEAETRNKQRVNVTLTADYASLSEVVVTGAGVNNTEHPTYNLAEPEGGRDAYSEYLQQKLKYPEQALKNQVEGKVTVQFTVDPNGKLGNFKVIHSLGFGCDDEAIRLIREGPAWFPSKKDDKPVTEEVKVGLKFEIPGQQK
jgi:TonB family protein